MKPPKFRYVRAETADHDAQRKMKVGLSDRTLQLQMP